MKVVQFAQQNNERSDRSLRVEAFRPSSKPRRILPGFRLTLGFSIFYLSLVVLIPLSALFFKTASLSWNQFWNIISAERVVASYKVTLYCSLVAALVNSVFGFIVAWSLVRYDFFGRKVLDALVDLPFALPTAVSGIALTAVYSQHGWIGRYLYAAGIESAFSPFGITVALTFIGLPFVVRTLQPTLQELNPELEEAAACLGASRLQTFLHVIIPSLLPALLTGTALAFARALGEYGSVVFISGNMPMKTEISALLIVTKLEQFDYVGAAALATVLLVFSFALMFSINILQWRLGHRARGEV